MALFGKIDAGLPLLSKFYQVEVPGYDRPIELTNSELYTFLSTTPGADFYGFRLTPPQLDFYAKLHEVTVILMDALADNTEIDVSHLRWLEDAFNQKRAFFSISGEGEPNIFFECEPVLARAVRVHLSKNRWPLLEELVTLLQNQQNRVKRCPECNSAYLETRQGQIYCSERCSARVRQRRKYQKSKGVVVQYAENTR